jgi:aminopeptidase YwaD
MTAFIGEFVDMRSTCYLIVSLFICVPLAAAPPVGGGKVIPNEGGINGFAPEWNENDFDLAGYLEGVGPDANLWFQHVQTLSNQWMEGRQPGTPGDELAARYITWYFNRAGLEPAFEGSWRQPFSFTLGRTMPEVHSASLSAASHELVHGEDFGVLANSGSLPTTSLPLSFVGYGIEDGPEGYTSFAEGDDLTGRAVLLLRYEPLDEDGRSQWAEDGFSPHSGIQDKFSALTDRGAAAILMVNPLDAADGRDGIESVASTAGFRPKLDIPALHISAKTATTLLHAASNGTTSLRDLQQDADEGLRGAHHFDNAAMVTIATDVSMPTFDTQNVAGVLPGTGDLANEWVIVGGHYDHIGHGYTGSRAPGDTRVHPGADDNASGVGTILILADRLAASAKDDDRDRRSIMFITFSGEEAGLHGSQHFVDNPTMDLSQTNLMLNLDMMGRLRNDTVALTGTGTAVEFDEMLPRIVEPSGLTVSTIPSGLGPSDHSNFYRKNIPVLFFFTGLHTDYHTPEDVGWRVNPEGTLKIINLCETLLDEATHTPDRYTFATATAGTAARQNGSKVRLGIMPSYSTANDPGVLIDGVTEGTSAHEAGIQIGDIITNWNGEHIENGSDLMKHLKNHKPGDVVTITVTRDGEPVDLPVTLKGRK